MLCNPSCLWVITAEQIETQQRFDNMSIELNPINPVPSTNIFHSQIFMLVKEISKSLASEAVCPHQNLGLCLQNQILMTIRNEINYQCNLL